MRRLTLVLLGSMVLCAGAAWAAVAGAPNATPAMSPASPADLTPLATGLPGGAQPVLTCSSEPITTCTSCLYFGIPSSYSCTTFCVNGVPHRSCNTCGEGCNL